MPSDVFNLEAEQFLLAAILRNPESYYEIDESGLQAADFAHKPNAQIFGAVQAAISEKSDPSLPFVIEYLRLAGKDKDVEYASSLSTVPCTIAQAKEYARVVKGLSVSRKLADAGVRIIDIASEKRTDFSSALAESQNVLRSVEETLPVNERSPSAADILGRMEVVQHVERIPLLFSPTLQGITGGLSRGHFWVIGGFSSTGKSAFACNIALDVLARKRSKLAIVSAEMTQEQYMTRLLAIESGIPQLDIANRVTLGVINPLQEAKQKLQAANLYIYDNLYTMSKIRTELQRLKNQRGIDVIILDYIQNITVTGDEVSDAREVAIECQRLAKDLDCTMIAFSQVSNQQAQFDKDDEGSEYYSFKGHGAIRDAADVAIMLYRNRAKQSSALRVDVKKNRHGPLSKFVAAFDLATGRIEEMEFEDVD